MNFKTFALLASIAVSGAANAGTLGWGWNTDMTAKINLSDNTSQTCRQLSARDGDSWFYAEIVTVGGKVDDVGCWNREEGTDVIRVRWSDGQHYSYPRSGFTNTPYFYQRMGAKKGS